MTDINTQNAQGSEVAIRHDERQKMIAQGCIHTRKALDGKNYDRPDLSQWQHDQSEYFDPTILEIVGEYAVWRDKRDAYLSQPPEASEVEAVTDGLGRTDADLLRLIAKEHARLAPNSHHSAECLRQIAGRIAHPPKPAPMQEVRDSEDCPFCGSNDIADIKGGDKVHPYQVSCKTCGNATAHHGDWLSARRAWMLRVFPTQAQNPGPGSWVPAEQLAEARREASALREHIAEQITHAENRIQDGREIGSSVWRIALEDIIRDSRAALTKAAL